MQGSCLMGFGAVTFGKGRSTGVPKDREVFMFEGHPYGLLNIHGLSDT